MDRIPRFLRCGPATPSQPQRLPWWRRRRPWWRWRRGGPRLRGRGFRHPGSATLIVNVRWGLSK